MRKMTKFTIFDKIFSLNADHCRARQFAVQSNLGDYVVEYENDRDPFKKISTLLNENKNNLLFCDKKVYQLYGKKLKVEKNRVFKGPANENFKTIDGVVEVLDFVQKNNFSKKETLIVAGGGIIQDVAAFVGATYKRGISWYFFPTTLLAMCDSCIGAKSSINYKGVKNQLGLFSSPTKIIINQNFIKTLDKSDLSNGLGEIFKLCIIAGKNFLDQYNKCVEKGVIKNFKDYENLVWSALSIKKCVIEKDEFDRNYRKSLNYGHTFGHALEILSDYQIPHGQAIAVGMLIVNEMSTRRGMLAPKNNLALKKNILELCSEKTLRIMKTISTKNIKALLQKDKKTLSNTLNLVFLKNFGCTTLLPLILSDELVSEIDEIILDNFHRPSFGK